MGEGWRNALGDVRYAMRMTLRTPGFTAVAVLILALGVGSASAVFSLVNGVLLEPLPFQDSERLVLLHSTNEADGGLGPFSYPDFVDVGESARTLVSVSGYSLDNFILNGSDGAERVRGELVTEEYFSLLGIPTTLGPGPGPGRVPGDEPIAILSDDLFRQRFGSDANIVGTEIDVNNQKLTVVGVMPRGFRGFTGLAELWVPMSQFDLLNPELREYEILDNRGTRWHSVIARLENGASFEEAREEVRAIGAALREAYPRSNGTRGADLVLAHASLVSDVRGSVWLLATAVGFLILISCANLANLFLGRVTERRVEIAVRLALGASRRRLVLQLLTETAALGLLGGALGALLARFCLSFLVAFAPTELPAYVDVSLDLRVFAFTMGLSLATGLAFGLLPAWTTTDASLARLSRESVRSGRRLRAQSALALAEVAIATVLLVGAGLVVKSFRNMLQFEPGFTAENLLTMGFYLPEDATARARESTSRFFDRMEESVSSLPGVQAAAVTSHIYFGDGYMSGDLTVEGYTPPSGAELRAYRQFVGPRYFDAIGLPIVRGRTFDEQDREGAPGALIVNHSFAQKLWPNEDPIGKRMKLGTNPERPFSTVVGVVADVKPALRLTTENRLPQVYAPTHQGGPWARAFVVRTSPNLDPLSVADTVQQKLRGLDPGIATFTVSTMEQLITRSRSTARSVTYLLAVFALFALGLAAIGLYAVVSHSVRRSMHEFGVRRALGAQRADVLGIVMKRSLALVAVGVSVGLAFATLTTRVLGTLLYGVHPLDTSTFGMVLVTMLLVVLCASVPPASRACSVDPAATLRRE